MTAVLKLLASLLLGSALAAGGEPDGPGEGEDTCQEELIHSYRLFPHRPDMPRETNYICKEFLKNDCCSFNSQKLIQVLWVRISQPRLQRVLTLHLSHVEFITNQIKAVLELFEKNELPEHVKYSAECLEAVDEMSKFVAEDMAAYLDKMFEETKVKFNQLYKFKKQFYCQLCDRDSHRFFQLTNKVNYFSTKFCANLAEDHVRLSYFLNKELVDIFKVVRNYAQCYSNKNYLLLDQTFEFRFRKDELEDLRLCKDDQSCKNFCLRYSLTDLPDIFIGNRQHLQNMRFFLENHVPDNRGFFVNNSEFVRKYYKMIEQQRNDELEEQGRAPIKAAADEEAPPASAKMDFYKTSGDADMVNAKFSVYKNSFEFYKSKFIKKKMGKIRRRIGEEYDKALLFQNFLTMNKARVDLSLFRTDIAKEGLNPYDKLDAVNLFAINANLTLFTKQISNAVGELLYLNETNVLAKVVQTSKLMKTDEEAKTAMVNFIKSKIFENTTDANSYLVENSYIDTGLTAPAIKALGLVVGLAVLMLG